MTHPIFKENLFAEKVIIVTGGGSGIGAEISKNFALLGANVVIASRKQERIEKAAEGDENLMPHFIEAAKAKATLGEMCDVLRGVFGEYREGSDF